MKGTITCTKADLGKAQTNGFFYVKDKNIQSGATERLFMEPLQLNGGRGRLRDTKDGKYYIEGELRIFSKSSQLSANIEEAKIALQERGQLIMVRSELAQFVGD